MKKQKAPRLVVAGLVKKAGKYLLIKEEIESGKKVWMIPGGGVEFGETLEEAVIREMAEELGLNIKSPTFLAFKEAVFPNFNYHSVIFFFEAETAGEPKIGEEKVLEAKFFSKSEIKKLDLVDSAGWLFRDLGIL